MKICPSCNRLYRSEIVVCPRDGGLLNTLREWRAGDSVSEKFRIVEKIGHGSLGPAFRAKVLPFGGIRVLKCLSVRLADDNQLIDHFQREIKKTSALRHVNAVHVESLERSPDGRPFIVMEYAPGLSLRELLSRGGFIPALDVVDIMGQICAALDRAHWQGIIHRNLKPDNVIVAEEHDGAPRVKVMEFGMASLRQAAAEVGTQVGDVVMTEHGAVVGTMEYMSPEQAAGTATRKPDERSDLYSVGVMMFEALTGELPLAADDPTGLLFQHQGIAANELLCGTVLKALQREPDCRFQTATEMIAALREVSHSLGRPTPVAVKSDMEAVAVKTSSPSQASPQTLKARESHLARASARQNAEPIVPRILERGHASPARPAPEVAAASIDAAFDEIRKSWPQTAGVIRDRRQARNKRVRISLLLVCCALGVLLAASEMYRNRGLLLPPEERTPSASPMASPEAPARDSTPAPMPPEIQTPLVAPSPDSPLPTVEEQGSNPPPSGASNDMNAPPAQRGAEEPSQDHKAPMATAARSRDRLSGASSDSAGRMTSDARKAEVDKRIAVGWLLVERGDHRGAVESFSQALKLDPSNVEAQAALRLARFAIQNPGVDVLPSQSPANGNEGRKERP